MLLITDGILPSIDQANKALDSELISQPPALNALLPDSLPLLRIFNTFLYQNIQNLPLPA